MGEGYAEVIAGAPIRSSTWKCAGDKIRTTTCKAHLLMYKMRLEELHWRRWRWRPCRRRMEAARRRSGRRRCHQRHNGLCRVEAGEFALVVSMCRRGRVKEEGELWVLGMLFTDHPLEAVAIAKFELGHFIDGGDDIGRQMRRRRPCARPCRSALTLRRERSSVPALPRYLRATSTSTNLRVT